MASTVMIISLPKKILLYSSLILILFFSFPNTRFHFLPSSSSKYTYLTASTHKQQKINGSHVKVSKLEQGLARARAAIREASRRRSYTSYTINNQSFIPRGSVYINPYAFHQSYIEMEKRFKIWTYKEGEPPLFHRGPTRNIYAIEGNVIDELECIDSPFAAPSPEEAHAFFLPVGIAKIVKYLYLPVFDYNRGRLQNVVADYIGVLANKYPYWNRTTGADHFYVACHDWGPDASAANHKLFKNLIRVLCNANVTEGFQPTRDVSLAEVKIPAGLTLGPPDLNESPDNKSVLAFFAGGPHGYVRKRLFQYWKDKVDNEIQVHEYLPKNVSYFELLSLAKYCLCPSGYEVASPRVVEAMHMGCVPVIISDGYVLPFSDVLDWSQFSVGIPVDKIPEIKKILEGIPRDKYLEMQKQVLKVKRHFVVHRPAQPFDLIHMVLHSVWLRRLNIKL